MRNTGPVPCEILVVGEAPGKEEDTLGVPFVGTSGQELRRMLEQAGFSPGTKRPYYYDSLVRFTNVFPVRPADNNMDAFCGKRGDVSKSYAHPPLSQGKYILEKHLHHLDALREEIQLVKPKLVVALGNTATWALLNRTGIGKLRGNVFPGELVSGTPVLPTYHPSAILRDWSLRTIALADLIKSRRFLDEGFNPPRRELWLEPTLDECREFLDRFLLGISGPRPPLISLDIETFGSTITCIGFAPSTTRSITIPFYDPGKPDRNYWPDAASEMAAWKMVYQVCTSDIPKVGQNGLYDIQYLRAAGIPVRAYHHDTMIRHHALLPEMDKGLGFLGSIYTDEAPWKLLRDRKKDTEFKLDDE